MATENRATEVWPELDRIQNEAFSAQDFGTRERASNRTSWLAALLGAGVLFTAGCRAAAPKTVPAGPSEQPTDSTRADPAATKTSTGQDDKSTPNEALDSAKPVAADLSPQLVAHAARRAQLARSLAQESGWNLYESEHYFLASPLADPLLIEGAKRRLDALRRQLERDFPPGTEPVSAGATLVRILPDRRAYVDWGGQEGSSAFWLSEQHTLVCYDSGDNLERQRETWPALQHVLVHEYFGQGLGIDETPPWLLYGVATRYAGLRLEGTGASEQWVEPAPATLDGPLREVLAGDGPMPLARLLAFDTDEFMGVNEFGSTAYRNLILAGGFVRFTEAKATKDGALPSDFLARYAGALQAGQKSPAALAEALQEADLEGVERAWRSWMEIRTGRALLKPGG